MKKQCSIYLTEKDLDKLMVIKEVRDKDNNSDTIKQLISDEIDRIRIYNDTYKI